MLCITVLSIIIYCVSQIYIVDNICSFKLDNATLYYIILYYIILYYIILYYIILYYIILYYIILYYIILYYIILYYIIFYTVDLLAIADDLPLIK